MKPAAIALAFLLLVAPSRAADWPQFLGPSRDGTSPETGLLDRWDKAGPRVVWKVPAGKGQSQVVVSNARAFTLMERRNDEVIVALDSATGTEFWSRTIGKRHRRVGSSATPTIDGNRLYVQAVSGPLLCLEADSGKVVWEVNVEEVFGAATDRYGATISPSALSHL